jgi:sensor histidine kinase regulating citrate/malate metabolism
VGTKNGRVSGRRSRLGDARQIDLNLRARNGDAVIEVKDRGLGLAPEEQRHIFESSIARFYNNLVSSVGTFGRWQRSG